MDKDDLSVLSLIALGLGFAVSPPITLAAVGTIGGVKALKAAAGPYRRFRARQAAARETAHYRKLQLIEAQARLERSRPIPPPPQRSRVELAREARVRYEEEVQMANLNPDLDVSDSLRGAAKTRLDQRLAELMKQA